MHYFLLLLTGSILSQLAFGEILECRDKDNKVYQSKKFDIDAPKGFGKIRVVVTCHGAPAVLPVGVKMTQICEDSKQASKQNRVLLPKETFEEFADKSEIRSCIYSHADFEVPKKGHPIFKVHMLEQTSDGECNGKYSEDFELQPCGG